MSRPCPICEQPAAPRATYCSITCQMTAVYRAYIADWKAGKVSGNHTSGFQLSSHLRRYMFEKYDSKCCLCGWGEKNPVTGKSPLQVHHVDGNCANNDEDNLQLLCPNCHSLTPNHGSLNIGKGRAWRRKSVA